MIFIHYFTPGILFDLGFLLWISFSSFPPLCNTCYICQKWRVDLCFSSSAETDVSYKKKPSLLSVSSRFDRLINLIFYSIPFFNILAITLLFLQAVVHKEKSVDPKSASSSCEYCSVVPNYLIYRLGIIISSNFLSVCAASSKKQKLSSKAKLGSQASRGSTSSRLLDKSAAQSSSSEKGEKDKFESSVHRSEKKFR